MTGADAVFLAATIFALCSGVAVYAFAWNIKRQRQNRLAAAPVEAPPIAAEEEASAPFDRAVSVSEERRERLKLIADEIAQLFEEAERRAQANSESSASDVRPTKERAHSS